MVSDAIVRINYYEDENQTPRFIKGILLEETQDFLKVQLQNYIVNINKKNIIKWEVSR